MIINLHGVPGEDGVIQGALECVGVPFLGSGVEASVVALNKHLTKLMASHIGVRMPGWMLVVNGLVQSRHGVDDDVRRFIEKPLRGGSSLSSRIVNPKDELPGTGRWIREEFVQGTDITVTIIEVDGQPRALPAVAISHGDEFYSEAVKTGSQWVRGVSANRPSALQPVFRNCEEVAIKLHSALGARHVSRCDFVLSSQTDEIHFLELNTIPGFSEVSNSAECAYAAGLSYDDFIALLVASSLQKRKNSVLSADV
ncbi:MAG: ATP-grasp domain-containing protein [Pseudomonadota bacterium]